MAELSAKKLSVGQETKHEPDNCINGINVMRIPSRDAYAFALQLVDVLFPKEELGSSLLFKSKKSSKQGLDSARVQQLLSLLDKRYGAERWDIKTLTSKVNQKCRDSGSEFMKKEPVPTYIDAEDAED